MEKIREYWQRVDSMHPGALVNGNIVGLYGDDAKYTQTGEKLIGIAMNVVLFEPKSPSNHFFKETFVKSYDLVFPRSGFPRTALGW